MSDTLHRLALRALGAPGEVRPRLPGRFEPDETAAPIDPGDPNDLAARPRATTTSYRNADATTTPPVTAAIPPAKLPASQADRAPAGAAIRPTADLAPNTAGPRAPPVPAAQRAERSPPARAAPAPETAPGQARTAPPAATPLLPAQAIAAPAAAGSRDPSSRRPADTAPPDIRISIGRIEVRAPPQPAPPPRRADPGTRLMSLDAYLAKGDRR